MSRNPFLQRARQLRRSMTNAEHLLWRHLRRDGLGVNFRRQAPVGRFIVDFVCFAVRLAVEVDGGHHLDSLRDVERDRWLESQGFRVVRFWNHDVLLRTNEVLAAIEAEVREKPKVAPGPSEASSEKRDA